MRTVEQTLEVFGGAVGARQSALGGEPPTHILGESFYSQLPLRHGDYIAKVQLVPVSEDLIRHCRANRSTSHKPDILRELVIDHFRSNTSVWEFRVQLCTDLSPPCRSTIRPSDGMRCKVRSSPSRD